MIQVSETAPGGELRDHLGRKISLDAFRGRHHVLLLSYPLDFTPTCSREIPTLESLVERLYQAHTMPLGLSVDSVHSHSNWGNSLGGVSFPLLSDFHPKGALASKFGIYLDKSGMSDRATVIVDAGGTVRYAASVTPSGERNIEELVAFCEELDRNYGGAVAEIPRGEPLPPGARLFVKSRCGFSRNVLNARANLHLEGELPVENVTSSAAAKAELKDLSGMEQVPCLYIDGMAMLESADIIQRLVTLRSGWWNIS